jgi:hypothetical protein
LIGGRPLAETVQIDPCLIYYGNDSRRTDQAA